MKNEQKQTILAGKVPAGYQQTEVGIIPEDWEVKSYGDIFTFLSTANNSRADLSEIGEYGYIHYGDIHTQWSNRLDCSISNIPRISKELVKSTFVQNGDLVVADASEDYEGIGKSIEVVNLSEGSRLVAGLHTYLLRDTYKIFSDGFRGYLCENIFVKRQIDRLATGLKVYGISKSNLSKILLPIPPLKEQTAIAEALSDMDSLLVSLEKLIEKKRAIKTGTMQQLLTGKKRLSAFAQREDGTPKGYKMTELGEIPEDWEIVSFDSILEKFQNGYAFSASKYAATGIPIITMSQIGLSGKFQFDLHNVNYWDFASSSDLKDFEVHYGDLLIAMTDVTPDKNLIGQMAISSYNDTALLNQRVGLIRCNPDLIQKQFLFYLSSMPIWKQYCKNVASLGVQANIGVKDIKRAKIVLPPLKEQTAIAEILSDMDAEIEALEAKRAKTEEIKQGMMQELLTGRTRLI